jgi:hypothetical protein
MPAALTKTSRYSSTLSYHTGFDLFYLLLVEAAATAALSWKNDR